MMTKREPASMGEYLAQSLGNEYIALAGIGYDVSAKQPRMENGTFVRSEMSFTAALNSIAYRLHALNNPLQFIEIKNSVFRSDRPQFETGGENFYLQYIPREQYDGFLFVDTIRATNLPID